MTLLEVKNLKVLYGKAEVLKGISFDVRKGECVGLIGPNGAGKSTLLRALSGLIKFHGRATFDGLDLSKYSPPKIVELGLVHCPEGRKLFWFMNVMDNLLLGAYTQDTTNENLEVVFRLFPILEARKDQQANTLSGGEAQMLAIGRSLLSNPKLLMLDEPTLGLAPKIRKDLTGTLENLKEMGLTVLLTEQNVATTLKLADKVYLIKEGEILKGGTPREFRGDKKISKMYLGL